MSDQRRTELWLNKAIELENRGHDFYEDAALKAQDPEVADFFKFMSAQELIHAKIIKKIYDRLSDANCWLEADGHITGGSANLNHLFSTLTKKITPSPDDGIVNAIDGGIIFETEARNFYEDELPNASCDAEKKFLTLMIAEENEHRQVLSDMKLFYTDPESWNLQEDNVHLDGA